MRAQLPLVFSLLLISKRERVTRIRPSVIVDDADDVATGTEATGRDPGPGREIWTSATPHRGWGLVLNVRLWPCSRVVIASLGGSQWEQVGRLVAAAAVLWCTVICTQQLPCRYTLLFFYNNNSNGNNGKLVAIPSHSKWPKSKMMKWGWWTRTQKLLRPFRSVPFRSVLFCCIIIIIIITIIRWLLAFCLFALSLRFLFILCNDAAFRWLAPCNRLNVSLSHSLLPFRHSAINDRMDGWWPIIRLIIFQIVGAVSPLSLFLVKCGCVREREKEWESSL